MFDVKPIAVRALDAMPSCPKCGVQATSSAQGGTQRSYTCRPCGKMFRAPKGWGREEPKKATDAITISKAEGRILLAVLKTTK